MDLKRVINLSQIGSHRLDADEIFIRDFLVGISFRQVMEYFLLADRKLRQQISGLMLLPESSDHHACYFGTHG